MGENELRELQRQTRIAAGQRAGEMFAGGVVLMLVFVAVFSIYVTPTRDWPAIVHAVIILGVPALLAIAAYRQMTRG